MKREITFAILIVIMMFAVVGISNTSDFPNFTGFVVGDNVTSNETDGTDYPLFLRYLNIDYLYILNELIIKLLYPQKMG